MHRIYNRFVCYRMRFYTIQSEMCAIYAKLKIKSASFNAQRESIALNNLTILQKYKLHHFSFDTHPSMFDAL